MPIVLAYMCKLLHLQWNNCLYCTCRSSLLVTCLHFERQFSLNYSWFMWNFALWLCFGLFIAWIDVVWLVHWRLEKITCLYSLETSCVLSHYRGASVVVSISFYLSFSDKFVLKFRAALVYSCLLTKQDLMNEKKLFHNISFCMGEGNVSLSHAFFFL